MCETIAAMVRSSWTVALLLLQQPPTEQQQVHTCRIAVVDSEGAEIGKAHVFVHRDPIATSAFPDRILDADAHGRFELSASNGFYDVCVMASAFTPMCRKLVIGAHDTQLQFKLSASPEVLKQTGDSFPVR